MTADERIAALEEKLSQKADWDAFKDVDAKMDTALELLAKMDKAFTIHVEVEAKAAMFRAESCPHRHTLDTLTADGNQLWQTVRGLSEKLDDPEKGLIARTTTLEDTDSTRVAMVKGARWGAIAVATIIGIAVGKSDLIGSLANWLGM